MSRNINAHNFISKYIIITVYMKFTKIIVDTVLLDSLGTLQRRKHKVLRLSERTVMNECAQLQQIYTVLEFLVFLVRKTLKKNPKKIFVPKYRISTAVMIVNPVRSPIVPPIAEIILTNVVALSLVTLVKTGTFSNVKLTNLSPSLLLSSKKILCIIYLQ